MDVRRLRVLAAETWLSRVPSIVRMLRELLPLRALFVLFTLRALVVSAASSAEGTTGSVVSLVGSSTRGDIADMRGIGDTGDIMGRGSTCMSVPPSGRLPGLGE